MKDGPDIARIASLIGDPARANMLVAMMAGKALTPTELAHEAGITPQTASSHLRQLKLGGLIKARRQGRHKYVALSNEEVGRALEALMGVAVGAGQVRTRTGPKDQALREARVCYNHLAGQRGTHLFDAMIARRFLATRGAHLELTDAGRDAVAALGIDIASLASGRSPLCIECLDWSERRSHLAGSLGRAIYAVIINKGWARREPSSRAVTFTRRGDQALSAWLSS